MYSKRQVFILGCIGALLFGLAITTMGSVIPQIKVRFGIDDIGAGALFSIVALGILAGSLIFGPIADKYGFRFFLAICCLGISIGFFGVAYAPSLAILNMCLFIFGAGGGAINGAVAALVSDISGDDKGANLSILGASFSVGALSMPLIFSFLEAHFSYNSILAGTGIFTIVMAVLYIISQFPAPKHSDGVSFTDIKKLLKEPLLLLVSFYLFFQSAFEGLTTNWTNIYMTDYVGVEASKALITLSALVGGMTVMRLLLGSVFRNMADTKIWTISFSLLFIGLLLNLFIPEFTSAIIGFILVGAGLAAGFPIMLSYVGNQFQSLSGTAFSIAFSISLIGNTSVNYGVGVIAQKFGIRHLITVEVILFAAMVIFSILILERLKKANTAS